MLTILDLLANTTKIPLNSRFDNYFDDYRDELMNENARIALVISSRKAQSSKELNIVKGEYLEVSIYFKAIFVNFSLIFYLRRLSMIPKIGGNV